MSPAIKAILAAAVGGAVPAALSSLQSCGSDPMLLVTQCLAGSMVAVAYLYAEKPKPKPDQEQKDDDGTPTPGGNR